uniref:Transposase n=1 Tax=Caenorhabditis tropicalis TaxID=1561998 RepID=A0A1I7UVP2_9PELO
MSPNYRTDKQGNRQSFSDQKYRIPKVSHSKQHKNKVLFVSEHHKKEKIQNDEESHFFSQPVCGHILVTEVDVIVPFQSTSTHSSQVTASSCHALQETKNSSVYLSKWSTTTISSIPRKVKRGEAPHYVVEIYNAPEEEKKWKEDIGKFPEGRKHIPHITRNEKRVIEEAKTVFEWPQGSRDIQTISDDLKIDYHKVNHQYRKNRDEFYSQVKCPGKRQVRERITKEQKKEIEEKIEREKPELETSLHRYNYFKTSQFKNKPRPYHLNNQIRQRR